MTAGLADAQMETAFDVCGPLPQGLTLLEASAGTGKTFTIAALVARYVAGGTPIDQLLVVTFTKAATSELRERVRARLVDTEAALLRRLAGAAVGGDDVTTLLADGSDEEVAARRRNVTAALADFDAATIATIHGFCEQILAGLGTTGDVERDITFVTDQSDLVTEVIDDLYLAENYASEAPPFDHTTAGLVGRTAVANPEAPITPALDLPAIFRAPVERARLAAAVRTELTARKLRHATMGYDDLLTRLAATLCSAQGPAARRRLRDRYRVVLVDEFQDTDPIQWLILRLAFGRSTLVLIGDPKQAVYSFRGADVYAYLEAASQPGITRATLGVNWRSDQGLLDALDAFFGGATLGAEAIRYRRVSAAGGPRPRLVDDPQPTPFRARVLDGSDPGLVINPRDGTIQVDSARKAIAADLAHDVVELLSSGAAIEKPAPDGIGTVRTPVGPADLAVLVRANFEADLVESALRQAGVPAVIAGTGSVFATDAAGQWLLLLQALERPANQGRALAAALTCFVGWTPFEVGSADGTAIANLQGTLHRWADILSRNGVASLLESMTADEGMPARLLAMDDGERQLTDLRHVGQLLHAEAVRAQLGTNALTAWLQLRIDDAGGDNSAEDRLRRLESDADAVQVITIHRSKGLEYPVVYLPYLWSGRKSQKEDIPTYHDPDNQAVRTIDVGGKSWRGFGEHQRLGAEEAMGEDLRLAYVALTRARHQVVVWWAGCQDCHKSSLARLLLRPDGAAVPDQLRGVPSDGDVVARLDALAVGTRGQVDVQLFGIGATATWVGPTVAPPTLAVRAFDRSLDTTWRRVSYSAITEAVHGQIPRDPRVGSEPDDAAVDESDMDVLVVPDPAVGAGPDLRDVASPMADLPGGAAFGTLVHTVLENVDFDAPDLDGRLLAGVREAVAGTGLIGGLEAVPLANAIRAAIETPLGPIAGGRPLRAFSRADRLDELDFELPLAGGDEPTSDLAVGAIAERLRAWLPAGDPLVDYADRLDDPALTRKLHGYLAGSIDLLLRVAGDDGPRYVVVDYKTNRLAPRDEPLTAWHYRPEALAEAMQAAHYPLQALIYSVAVHRYLRWRQPDYSPERHLGGVAYLFLRGMSGAATPIVDGTPVGVFAWTPPAGLITDLSDLFDRGTAQP